MQRHPGAAGAKESSVGPNAPIAGVQVRAHVFYQGVICL